eukprot:TRINITY_DN36020_c0_g1_i4.p1 TRINITY_DN36020_c0_g1~~TRINITY_DN36020_c0_g1_i4.p1  ORF type:complete len:222 (-),score=58.60 TRINITY_DN36020_c0_g1_i4:126-791(-)
MLVFFLMIRRPPRSTLSSSSAASDVYKRQLEKMIKIRQDDTDITEKLNERYPAAFSLVPTPSANTRPVPQTQEPNSNSLRGNEMVRRRTTSIIGEGFLTPAQMLGLDARMHDSAQKDEAGNPIYTSTELRESGTNGMERQSSGQEVRNVGSGAGNMLGKHGGFKSRSTQDQALEEAINASLSTMSDLTEKSRTIAPGAGAQVHKKPGSKKKRPGHARKHSF